MASLSKVKKILEMNSVITSETYCKIINDLPPKLACKLRLAPDKNLNAKLAHLLAVSRIEAHEEDLGFNYLTISVEGSKIRDYPFDHDAIVKNLETNKIYVIDCTSSTSWISRKQAVLEERVRGIDIIDSHKVHVFKAEKFKIEVSQPDNLTGTSSPIFKLFDAICGKSKLFLNQFYSACEAVYDKVVKSDLGNERVELNERYDAWNSEWHLVNRAVTLARSHDLNDAKDFKEITEGVNLPIYYETFKKILSQQRPLNQPFQVMPAELNLANDLKSVLRELDGNLICKLMVRAIENPKDWFGVDARGHITAMITRPNTRTALLPKDSEFVACAKFIADHVFQLHFTESIIDDNFLQQVLKERKTEKRQDFYSKDVIESYAEILNDYSKYHEEFSRDSTNVIRNSILGKISSLGALYSDESAKPSAAVCGSVSGVVDRIRQMKLGELIDHSYEISKTFTASLKVSPRDNYYYVGVNGPYSSVTIVKMSGTQDSFNVSSYFCIYRPVSTEPLFCVKNHRMISEKYCQTKTRTYNRNTLAHALKLPFAFISLLTWEIENNSSENATLSGIDFMRLVVNSTLHVSVNSDQFSQCSEQLRYLFTSNIGYGASAGAICEKIDFVRTNTTWELLYLFRMLKMACSLNVVFKNRRIGELVENGKWTVALPNSVNPVCSFSHLVSSMYYCNVYNKFRAFHEISEAICFNELESENVIYLNSIKSNINHVQGISNESYLMLYNSQTLDNEKFVNNEVAFCQSLIKDGPGRFKLSLSFIIGATRKHVKIDDSTISSIYKALSESPIEACTMRGAMECGAATGDHQGIRSVSSIIEELISEANFNIKAVNDSVVSSLGLTDYLNDNPFDFSIFSAVARQFNNREEYRYRIVQKDQKGHREISVLNAKFRMGALFCEKTAQVISKLVNCDVLDEASKDVIMERKVRECIRGDENETVISDNSDQKRWGPNHLLHSFSAMFLGALSEDLGLFRILNLILHKGENKMAKFPENLIDLFVLKKTNSRSAPLQEFFERHNQKMEDGKFEERFEWGMCQGIFHRTSSLYHGIMCSVVSDVCKNKEDFPRHTCHSYVTSDDAERIITIHERVDDRILLCKKVHSIINNVGCLMNILRNESKSVFSFHITEFNSIFYHNGYLATPTLKQRISKLDIGEGADPILDYLTAISLSMGYFQNGGSYFGACTIMLLNIALHTEQWNRWYLVSKGDLIFKRPVEFGGFPYIEPLSAMYSGPISSIFLRSLKHINGLNFSHMVMKTTMIEAAEVNMDDFQRIEGAPSFESDLKVFKNAGPLGVFSFSRTDRRLSRFEKRHKLSKWVIKERGITLDKTNSDALKFLFNLQRITKTCQFEKSSGINSFFIRFSDPWVNNERACLRLHSNSLFVQNVLAKKFNIENKVCPKDLYNFINSLSTEQVNSYYRYVDDDFRKNRKPSVMAYRLQLLMEDAEKVYEVMAVPYELKYIEADTKNCIARINLTSHTTMDDEVYYVSLLKSTIGEGIKEALIEKSSDNKIWDKIKLIPGLPSKNVIEGIFFCSNVTQLHEKYVRGATKVICPSNTVPNNISEFMYQVMLSKFTEKYGVKVKRFPTLASSTMVYSAFNTCNNELLIRSLKFWHDKEKMIDFTDGREPAPFGILSSNADIGPHDDFVIDENARIEKTVHVHAKGKFNFISKIKMWVGAYVMVKLSEATKQSLLRSEFTNFHEYCLDSNTFYKNQTRLLYDVSIGGKQCFEIQKYDLINKQYYHYFLYDSGTHLANVEANLRNYGNDKLWAKRIVKFINDQKSFSSGVRYEMLNRKGSTPDIIYFIPVSSADKFRIRTFSNNLSVFIEHQPSGVLIPVCSQQIDELKDINLGLNYNIENLEEALEVFKNLGEKLTGHEDLDEETREFVALILFKSSVFTGLSEINEWINRHNYSATLSSKESADILRSLILCCTAKKLIGNRVRIHHYFLNLFRNSPHYNNGITRLKTDAVEISEPEAEKEINVEMGEETIDFNVSKIVKPADITVGMLKARGVEDLDKDIVTDRKGFDILDDMALRVNMDVKTGLFEGSEDEEAEESSNESGQIDEDDPDPLRTYVPFSEDIPAVSASYVINRPFEDCRGMIEEIRDDSINLKPKRAPRRYYAVFKNVFDVFKALSTIELNGDRSVKDCLSEMYGDCEALFKVKYPFSAMCLVDLYFV